LRYNDNFRVIKKAWEEERMSERKKERERKKGGETEGTKKIRRGRERGEK